MVLLKKGVSKLSFEHTAPNFRHTANTPLPVWNCLVWALVQPQPHKAQHRLLHSQTQAQPQAPVKPGTHGCKRSDTDVKAINSKYFWDCKMQKGKKPKQTNQMWISLGEKKTNQTNHYSDFSSWAKLSTLELQMSQKKYDILAFEKCKSQPRNQIVPLYKAIQLL